MANVRLLRQQLLDYNRSVERANRAYASDYDTYKGQVEAWNKIAKATPYITEVVGTSMGMLGGGWAGTVRLSDGRVVDYHGDKVVSRKNFDQYGYYYDGVDEKTREVDTGEVDPVTGKPIMRTETYTVNRFTETPTKAGPMPDVPEMGYVPREPNLTQSDIRALASPPTNAAGVEMARAKGYSGVSELAGENDAPMRGTAFQSAFNDPNNPQYLKDRGILAKTLAGKL